MLQLLWNAIAYRGVRIGGDTSENKHILLVNSLTIVISVFSLLNVPVGIFFSVPTIFAILPAIYALILPFTIVLNGLGYRTGARLFFTEWSILFIVACTACFGQQTNFHFFLVSAALATMFIFPAKQKALKKIHLLLVVSLFIIGELYITNVPPLFEVAKDLQSTQKIVIDIGAGLLVVSFGLYINSTFQTAEKYLEVERDKSQKLLLNILPESVVHRLRESPDTIAERFDDCTILFSDIVGFSGLSRTMPAVAVVSLLNEIFSAFDDLAEKHGLEKIKTIGDAYMVVGGLPEPHEKHAENVARFALDMLSVVRDYRMKNDIPLELRVGVATGDAVAGVIGKKKFIYDLWGDSVNTASRMESHGVPGQIQVTETTYHLLKDTFSFEARGEIEVKGLGNIRSYLLVPPTLGLV